MSVRCKLDGKEFSTIGEAILFDKPNFTLTGAGMVNHTKLLIRDERLEILDENNRWYGFQKQWQKEKMLYHRNQRGWYINDRCIIRHTIQCELNGQHFNTLVDLAKFFNTSWYLLKQVKVRRLIESGQLKILTPNNQWYSYQELLRKEKQLNSLKICVQCGCCYGQNRLKKWICPVCHDDFKY